MPFKSLQFHHSRASRLRRRSDKREQIRHSQHAPKKRHGKLAKLNEENLLLLHDNFSNYLHLDLNAWTVLVCPTYGQVADGNS